ncbi:unnamed protein product [Dicrocoelium dendriticum]|nr:unnamed protein product [Dicrocoelium dendriticum]
MGVWCFNVTDLPGIQRLFAKAFFTQPPNSTYEEVGLSSLSIKVFVHQALDFLNRSRQLADDMPVSNYLVTAKCYQRLHNNEMAAQFCNKVLEFSDEGFEVAEAKEEARKILKKL